MSYIYHYILGILSLFILRIHGMGYYGYRSNEIISLCKDPIIYTADRLLNNTVRLYRGNYYWELNGMPDKVGFLSGPYRIPYPGFLTVYPNVSVVTVLGSGDRIGRTFRIEGTQYHSWDRLGRHVESGNLPIPKSGISTIFHNGSPNNPMFIALESIKVRYMTTKAWDFPRIVGKSDGYIGGQFGEQFEPDITAAFSYQSTDSEDEYFVFLFKRHKYCFRTAKKKCVEWRLNKELFGCNNKGGGNGGHHAANDKTGGNAGNSPHNLNFPLISSLILIKLIVIL